MSFDEQARKAIACAKSQGWDPCAELAQRDLQPEDVFALVVQESDHDVQVFMIDSPEMLIRACAQVPGKISDQLTVSAQTWKPEAGVLRTFVLCLAHSPVLLCEVPIKLDCAKAAKP